MVLKVLHGLRQLRSICVGCREGGLKGEWDDVGHGGSEGLENKGCLPLYCSMAMPAVTNATLQNRILLAFPLH